MELWTGIILKDLCECCWDLLKLNWNPPPFREIQEIKRVLRDRAGLHGRAGDPTGLSSVRQLEVEPEVSATAVHERLEIIYLHIAND